MRRVVVSLLTVLLLVVGLVASAVLLGRTVELAGGAAADEGVCTTLFAHGCDATLRHAFAKQLGIPLAGWGVIYFASVLVLLVMGRVLDDGFDAAAALLALVGGLASLALVAALLAGAFPVCPLCLVANGANLLAVVPLLRWGGRPISATATRWGGALKYLAVGKPKDRTLARWRIAGLALSLLVAVVLYQWILIEVDRAEASRSGVKLAMAIEAYDAALPAEVPVADADPTLGPATARATLVVFSDAFCPHCRSFWTIAGQLLERFPGDLRIVFKHFPLERLCNPKLEATLHPLACRAGLALEAARAQGQFWAFQDALAAQGLRTRGDPFQSVASQLGLDTGRFEEDLPSDASRLPVDEGVRLGNELGLQGTPAFFLNGRRVRGASPDVLEALIRRAVTAAD